MADQVYNATTVQEPTKKCFVIPTEHLSMVRWVIKVAEVILSFLAFILEEVVTSCMSCSPLYFFEFVSCTAFLFTTLLLILLSTTLHRKVGIESWSTVDFVYTGAIAFFFFISTIVFIADNGGTPLEKAAVVFGFLATFAFIVDIGMFVKNKGIPFLKKSPQTPSTAQNAEEEKLRSNGAE
ncbi:CKLF-like MARVEL transmembrane domain-containing protein 6 [Megalops cyprinoides]|uniref:CKLF-like MARVEL transmembrane domain-containing protein 6 n=1 Tax=Megalops cyprinoides TaxID=118141 RepID=UPI001864D916|nr:CKLF-like MARVEL transmembrane domain-containing protein 6 [Megalops cyprinoides]